MSGEKTGLIKKTFSLTDQDIKLIKFVKKTCGFVSDSEALRAMIRFFANNAPCMVKTLEEAWEEEMKNRILKGR
jgi:hypothetical protein